MSFRATRVLRDRTSGTHSYSCLGGKFFYPQRAPLAMPGSAGIDPEKGAETTGMPRMALFADAGSDEDFEAALVERLAARALDAVGTVFRNSPRDRACTRMRAHAKAIGAPVSKIDVLPSAHVDNGCENQSETQFEHGRDYQAQPLVERDGNSEAGASSNRERAVSKATASRCATAASMGSFQQESGTENDGFEMQPEKTVVHESGVENNFEEQPVETVEQETCFEEQRGVTVEQNLGREQPENANEDRENIQKMTPRSCALREMAQRAILPAIATLGTTAAAAEGELRDEVPAQEDHGLWHWIYMGAIALVATMFGMTVTSGRGSRPTPVRIGVDGNTFESRLIDETIAQQTARITELSGQVAELTKQIARLSVMQEAAAERPSQTPRVVASSSATASSMRRATSFDTSAEDEDNEDCVQMGFLSRDKKYAHRCRAGFPKRYCMRCVKLPFNGDAVFTTSSGRCWHASAECLSLAGRDYQEFAPCDGKGAHCMKERKAGGPGEGLGNIVESKVRAGRVVSVRAWAHSKL